MSENFNNNQLAKELASEILKRALLEIPMETVKFSTLTVYYDCSQYQHNRHGWYGYLSLPSALKKQKAGWYCVSIPMDDMHLIEACTFITDVYEEFNSIYDKARKEKEYDR